MLTITYLIQFMFLPALVFIGICFLERFLAQRREVWPGLILPVGFFLFFPLPWLLSAFFIKIDSHVVETFLSALVMALIYSIPGTILTIIYVISRKKLDDQKKSRAELRKMDIQDL